VVHSWLEFLLGDSREFVLPLFQVDDELIAVDGFGAGEVLDTAAEVHG
jgi:hypothetical protein